MLGWVAFRSPFRTQRATFALSGEQPKWWLILRGSRKAPGRRPEAPQTQCTVMEEPAGTSALGQESGIYVDIYIYIYIFTYICILCSLKSSIL